jgi:glycosyltransferase involved in cell wall biosynthesis
VSYAKIASGLAARGHVVELVTSGSRLTGRLRAEGLDVTQLPGRDTGPREVWVLWRTLRRLRAQAVVADTPRDVRLAAYATLLHPAPILYRYNLNYRRPRNHLLDRIYLSRVSACVFQSDFIRDDAHAHVPRMSRIPSFQIPNGYDTELFAARPEAGQAFRARYRIRPEQLVVLTTAKLARNKGQDVAIAALDRVRQAGIDVIYVLCGDGATEEGLRRLAHAHGVEAVFTGLLETDQLITALSAADLVVHPSLQEIFPNAVGEAMACACPVVAADAGGTGELLGREGSTGLLVSPGDPAALADAVLALARDPVRRAAMGAGARRRIEQEFPLARMIDGYEATIAQVVGSHG